MKNYIKISNQNQTNMQNKNTQPIPMLSTLHNAITSEISNQVAKLNAQNPNIGLIAWVKCSQVLETGDNSAMLNLAISFDAPDTNHACDFAANEADAAARYQLYNWFQMLTEYDPDCELKTNMLEPNAYNIYIHNCGLNYCNATLIFTDSTLYLTCVYNQQF